MTTGLSKRQNEDVDTLVATVLGTFTLADYTPAEREQVWASVKHAIELALGLLPRERT